MSNCLHNDVSGEPSPGGTIWNDCCHCHVYTSCCSWHVFLWQAESHFLWWLALSWVTASTARCQVCQVLVEQIGLMVVTVMFTPHVDHIMFVVLCQATSHSRWLATDVFGVWVRCVFFVNLAWYPGDVVWRQIPNLMLLTNREAPESVDLLLDQRVRSQNGSRCARWHGDWRANWRAGQFPRLGVITCCQRPNDCGASSSIIIPRHVIQGSSMEQPSGLDTGGDGGDGMGSVVPRTTIENGRRAQKGGTFAEQVNDGRKSFLNLLHSFDTSERFFLHACIRYQWRYWLDERHEKETKQSKRTAFVMSKTRRVHSLEIQWTHGPLEQPITPRASVLKSEIGIRVWRTSTEGGGSGCGSKALVSPPNQKHPNQAEECKSKARICLQVPC